MAGALRYSDKFKHYGVTSFHRDIEVQYYYFAVHTAVIVEKNCAKGLPWKLKALSLFAVTFNPLNEGEKHKTVSLSKSVS